MCLACTRCGDRYPATPIFTFIHILRYTLSSPELSMPINHSYIIHVPVILRTSIHIHNHSNYTGVWFENQSNSDIKKLTAPLYETFRSSPLLAVTVRYLKAKIRRTCDLPGGQRERSRSWRRISTPSTRVSQLPPLENGSNKGPGGMDVWDTDISWSKTFKILLSSMYRKRKGRGKGAEEKRWMRRNLRCDA